MFPASVSQVAKDYRFIFCERPLAVKPSGEQRGETRVQTLSSTIPLFPVRRTGGRTEGGTLVSASESSTCHNASVRSPVRRGVGLRVHLREINPRSHSVPGVRQFYGGAEDDFITGSSPVGGVGESPLY